MTEPIQPVITTRLPGPNPIRVAIVVAVVIVLALSAVITLAASPSPAVTGAAPSAAAASAGTKHIGPSTPGRGPAAGFGARIGGFGFGFGFGGFGSFGNAGIGGATIVAINGSSLSLKTADGWTRAITVGSSTKLSRAGKAIGLGDLKVGDAIGFRETKASDGTYTINAVTVILPTLAGQVTAISANTITIKQFNGTPGTIHVTSSTTFRIFGTDKATLANLKVGMTVGAQGTKASDGSLDALSVSGGQFKLPGPGHKVPGKPGANPNGSAKPNASTTP
ncbi:MAG TPA: DUF5666 domain-containing protein [Candidatus Limnocylindrales bacterium]